MTVMYASAFDTSGHSFLWCGYVGGMVGNNDTKTKSNILLFTKGPTVVPSDPRCTGSIFQVLQYSILLKRPRSL